MLAKYKEAFADALAPHIQIDKEWLLSMIELAPDHVEGDLAFPCFQLAKTMKKAPHVIAQELTWLVSHSFFERVIAVGPYVNVLLVKKSFFHEVLAAIMTEAKEYWLGAPKNQTWLVEGWSPNTHKALHVGHLRNALMSESVCTLLEAAGYNVIRTAYWGDIGAHVAKWIWYYITFDNSAWPQNPEEFCKWASLLYIQASKKVKEDSRYEQEVHDVQHRLEAGEKELVDLWKATRLLSIEWITDVFRELGCTIERMYFESDVEQPGIDMVKEMEASQQTKEIRYSDGAIIADLEIHDLWVFVLLKKNGTSLYSTKDIALAYLKEEEYVFDRSLYVVATEQNWHFKQLFKTLELYGYDTEKLHHLGYEMVELSSWKMSSRAGTIITYHDYRDNMIKKAKEQLEWRDLNDLQKEEIARHVTFGALKFSMLLQDSYKKIIFDMEQSLRFDGETGPYVQYTHARASSILRAAQEASHQEIDYSLLVEKEETSLVLHLSRYADVVQKAAKEFRPNLVARYVLELSHLFNAYYQKHKVLVENEAMMKARLVLVSCTRQVLENGLTLLGINSPEIM